jgi:hypothetical protein
LQNHNSGTNKFCNWHWSAFVYESTIFHSSRILRKKLCSRAVGNIRDGTDSSISSTISPYPSNFVLEGDKGTVLFSNTLLPPVPPCLTPWSHEHFLLDFQALPASFDRDLGLEGTTNSSRTRGWQSPATVKSCEREGFQRWGTI